MIRREIRIGRLDAPLPLTLRVSCSTAATIAPPSYGISRARSLAAISAFLPKGGLT